MTSTPSSSTSARARILGSVRSTVCAAVVRQVKAASEFHKSKRRRLGLHIYCKTCCAAASASRAKTKQPVSQPTVDAKVITAYLHPNP